MEIDKTKRRSNAIEFVMIPKLKSQSQYIRMRLDELERDTFTTRILPGLDRMRSQNC